MKLSDIEIDNFKWIDFHTHCPPKDRQALGIVSCRPGELLSNHGDAAKNCLLSAEIHPWRLPNDIAAAENHIAELAACVKSNEVAAIGEAGLDRLRGPDLKLQLEVFRQTVQIATKYDKPLIVHCVRCFPEIIALRKQLKSDIPWLIHGFRGKPDAMRQLFDQGFFISLGKIFWQHPGGGNFFRQNKSALNHLCLETDATGDNINQAYVAAAEAIGLDKDVLCRILRNNCRKFFNF